MDNTNTPVIDLNIDPNMIAARDDSPQAVPSNVPSTPPVAPLATPGVIDISPESTDQFPPVSPSIPEPKVQDITPTATEPTSSHLSDLATPTQETVPVDNTPSPLPPLVPPSAPLTPNITSEPTPAPEPVTPVTLEPAISTTPSPVVSATPPQEPITQSSPLAEDPDLVKLIK